jgi:hypothetical protein
MAVAENIKIDLGAIPFEIMADPHRNGCSSIG